MRGATLHALMVTNMYPTPAAPDDGAPVAGELASLRSLGLEIELLHLQREERGRSVYLGLGRRARALVAEIRPDIVLVMYGGVMAQEVARAVRDVPVLITFRGTDILGGKGRNPVHGASRRYGVVASRRAARRAAGIVVKSRNLVDALRRSIDRSRAWVVPDGIDLDCFAPRDKKECRAALEWHPRRKHVLFPGSPLRPEKRFALARAAVALAREQTRDVELHALHGVPHGDVPTWLNAADALLLTSAHEGSPNSVKEALACNVPVVSVDVGDVSERVAGIAGCYISEATPTDIASKLVRALEHGPVSGRERVAALSLDRVAVKLAEIYAHVARGDGGAEI